jgi:hypothetical protein
MNITVTWFTIIIGGYTLICLFGINFYESKLTDSFRTSMDYKRALDLAQGSKQHHSAHYTWLQMEVGKLNAENEALQAQIKSIKDENSALRNGINPSIWSVRPVTDSAVYVAGESKDMHYESSTYKTDRFESAYENSKYNGYSLYANQIELELEHPYVRQYGYKP